MTSAAELDARTRCADLARQLSIAQMTIAELQACRLRLNALVVVRDTDIDALHMAVTRLQAELDAARAGLLELPY